METARHWQKTGHSDWMTNTFQILLHNYNQILVENSVYASFFLGWSLVCRLLTNSQIAINKPKAIKVEVEIITV